MRRKRRKKRKRREKEEGRGKEEEEVVERGGRKARSEGVREKEERGLWRRSNKDGEDTLL